ncbi:MAG: hypothetical protein KDE34_21650 [Anaerolineales bacterium]|nr:hypothetical protein [Anaerolineales bacterium]
MQILKIQLARLPTRPGANQPHLACQAVTDTVTASLFPGRVMTSNNLDEAAWPWPADPGR